MSYPGVTRYNPAFLSIFGLDPEDLHRKNLILNDYIHPNDRENFQKEIRALVEGKKSQTRIHSYRWIKKKTERTYAL
ncbi:MAG: PAS domain-containing protein [Candidatus Bathyarchaeota archaeon]|nr:PAS domain-containing protein [Candidatus Bathyarchaeota archaeon]